MEGYKHSVLLDKEKCTGCTTCLQHCPTEAIRIVEGKARIDSGLCIDCGECIRRCPHQAKKASAGSLDSIKRFKWKIALPAPALYAQFDHLDDIDYVLNGLLKIGFDEVFEVAKAAEFVSEYTRRYIRTEGIHLPLISSACPVVVRLINLLFPSLSDNIIHLLPPVETAARMARKKAKEEHPELKDEEIGVCFISPCPGKVSYVNNYKDLYDLHIDEVVPISDVYFLLINAMKREENIESLSESGMIGVGWASSGGESTAILNEGYLAADGIENVIRVLNSIEDGNIPPVDFIELNACPGGCVGGVMTVQNPFIAKSRLQSLRRYLPVSMNRMPADERYIPQEAFFNQIEEFDPGHKLGNNMAESLRMMADIQRIKDQLPGIDCGACGAPTCRAHAEDLVVAGHTAAECPILKARSMS